MAYQPVDQQGRPKAVFPTSQLDFRDFLFWRSWQGESVVKTMYYVHIVLAFVVWVSYIVSLTASIGVGGFFLGFFLGLLIAVVMIVYARVICELVLSVFSIRDNMERLASQGGQSHVVPPNPTYPTYQQPAQQPYQSL